MKAIFSLLCSILISSQFAFSASKILVPTPEIMGSIVMDYGQVASYKRLIVPKTPDQLYRAKLTFQDKTESTFLVFGQEPNSLCEKLVSDASADNLNFFLTYRVVSAANGGRIAISCGRSIKNALDLVNVAFSYVYEQGCSINRNPVDLDDEENKIIVDCHLE